MKVKQNSIHKSSAVEQCFRHFVALCALCISQSAGFAQSIPNSFGGVVASVRLIAAHQTIKGAYQTGVAIVMTSGSHTYWKQPGDAGVPPVFAFNGSVNVAKADVLFPAPRRITEDGLDAFGYTDAVVFPVVVTPGDPAKPSMLHVDLTYAVCNKICMPGHSSADLKLPAATASDAALGAAFAAVPMPLADRAALTVTRVAGGAKPTWSLAWTGQDPLIDIFADAPEGYAFDTKAAAAGHWTLVASQIVRAPGVKSVPVTLTLAGKDKSFVTTETLDPSSP